MSARIDVACHVFAIQTATNRRKTFNYHMGQIADHNQTPQLRGPPGSNAGKLPRGLELQHMNNALYRCLCAAQIDSNGRLFR